MLKTLKVLLTSIVFVWVLGILKTLPMNAQSLEAVQTIAQKLTVHIFGQADPGSGVIIAKQGNVYTVLTAGHVLDRTHPGEEVSLDTFDKKSHNVRSFQIFPGTDLALLSFESSDNYPVATLSNYTYPLYEHRDYGDPGSYHLRRSNPERNRHIVFTSGWPNDDSKALAFTPGFLVDTSGSAISTPGTRSQGYELIYSNLTYPGMSGGPVLDTIGRVIGIHGRADGRGIDQNDRVLQEFLKETEDINRIKIGESLGISTATFLRLAKQNNIHVDLKIENSAPPILSHINFEKSWRPPISSKPESPFYWIDRGNQLWRIGQTEEAQKSFDRAIAIRSNLSLAWFAKGFVYGFSDDFANALSACNRAIDLYPDRATDYEDWRCKAGALQNLGRYSDALSALNTALNAQQARISQGGSKAGQNPSDYVQQAELFFAQQQYRGSIDAYDRALALLQDQYHLPPSPQLLNGRGLTLLYLDRKPEALKDLQTALELDSNYATGWITLGKIHQALNQFPEALKAYDRATSISPNDPYAWNERGVLLYNMGQCPAAIESIEKALTVDANYSPAQDNRKALIEACSGRLRANPGSIF